MLGANRLRLGQTINAPYRGDEDALLRQYLNLSAPSSFFFPTLIILQSTFYNLVVDSGHSTPYSDHQTRYANMSAVENNGTSSKPAHHENRPELRSGGLVNVQPPRPDDLQPRYAHQFESDTENPALHSWYAGFIHGLGSMIGCMGAIPCCFCCPNPFKPVSQGEVGLVSKFGRYVFLFYPPSSDSSDVY